MNPVKEIRKLRCTPPSQESSIMTNTLNAWRVMQERQVTYAPVIGPGGVKRLTRPASTPARGMGSHRGSVVSMPRLKV